MGRNSVVEFDYRVDWRAEFGRASQDGGLCNKEVFQHCATLLRYEFARSRSRST